MEVQAEAGAQGEVRDSVEEDTGNSELRGDIRGPREEHVGDEAVGKTAAALFEDVDDLGAEQAAGLVELVLHVGGFGHVDALDILRQPDLGGGEFDGEDVDLVVGGWEGFGEERGEERGGDDGGFEASGREELGHVYGGYEMALSHEGQEEDVKLLIGLV